jgi:hypothetical protein
MGALVPVEQDTITFYGHKLVAVRTPDGRIAVVLNWLCDGLSLDRTAQKRRIERRTALHEGLVEVEVRTGGGHQNMDALTLDVLPGYLYTIDETRVKEEARPDVVVFQRECTQVLAEHFARKHLPALPASADPAAAAIVAQIAELSGVLNLMREHLAALQGLPEQVSHVAQVVEFLAERQSSTEAQVAELDARTDHLTPAHARTVQEGITRLVRATKHMPGPLTYGLIYDRLQRHFRANSYEEISESQFDAVMEWLHAEHAELDRVSSGEESQQGNLFS